MIYTTSTNLPVIIAGDIQVSPVLQAVQRFDDHRTSHGMPVRQPLIWRATTSRWEDHPATLHCVAGQRNLTPDAGYFAMTAVITPNNEGQR